MLKKFKSLLMRLFGIPEVPKEIQGEGKIRRSAADSCSAASDKLNQYVQKTTDEISCIQDPKPNEKTETQQKSLERGFILIDPLFEDLSIIFHQKKLLAIEYHKQRHLHTELCIPLKMAGTVNYILVNDGKNWKCVRLRKPLRRQLIINPSLHGELLILPDPYYLKRNAVNHILLEYDPVFCIPKMRKRRMELAATGLEYHPNLRCHTLCQKGFRIPGLVNHILIDNEKSWKCLRLHKPLRRRLIINPMLHGELLILPDPYYLNRNAVNHVLIGYRNPGCAADRRKCRQKKSRIQIGWYPQRHIRREVAIQLWQYYPGRFIILDPVLFPAGRQSRKQKTQGGKHLLLSGGINQNPMFLRPKPIWQKALLDFLVSAWNFRNCTKSVTDFPSDNLAENRTGCASGPVDNQETAAGLKKEHFLITNSLSIPSSSDSGSRKGSRRQQTVDDRRYESLAEIYKRNNVDQVDIISWDPKQPDVFFRALDRKLRSGRLIGLELLQFVSDEAAERTVHKMADRAIPDVAEGGGGYHRHYPLLALSFSLNALRNYQNSFHDHLPNLYPESQKKGFDGQKLQNLVRRIADYYSSLMGIVEKRQINFFIRQTIIPQAFLEKFISFAGELYSNLFYGELPGEQAEDEILDAYFQTIQSGLKAGRKYQFTSQIATVKDLMANSYWNTDLAAYLKIILRCIDHFYWDDKQTEKVEIPYSEYFGPFFDRWKQKKKKLIRTGSKKQRNRNRRIWKASFELSDTQIRLSLPAVRIPEGTPKNTVQMLLHAERTGKKRTLKTELFEFDGLWMTARKICQLEGSEIFDHLRFEVRIQDQVIFDTKEELYRNYLLFDESGSEITGALPRSGTVISVFPEGIKSENIELVKRRNGVVFGLLKCSESETARIGNDLIAVQLELQDELVADVYSGAYAEFGSRKLPICRSVRALTFYLETKEVPDPEKELYLLINYRHIHPTLLQKEKIHGWNAENGAFVLWKLQADLQGLLDDGLNVIQIENHRSPRHAKPVLCIYDPELKVHTDSETMTWQVQSSWIGIRNEKGICYESGPLAVDRDHLISIKKEDSKADGWLEIIIEPDSPWYRIDGEEWRNPLQPILSAEISPYSKISFCGIHPESVRIGSVQDPWGDENCMHFSHSVQNQEVQILSSEGIPWIAAVRICDEGKNISPLCLEITGTSYWSDIDINSDEKTDVMENSICSVLYYSRTVLISRAKFGVSKETGKCWIAFETLGPDAVSLTISRSFAAEYRQNSAGETFLDDEILFWQDGLQGQVELELDDVPTGIPLKVTISAGDEDDLFSEGDCYTVFQRMVEFWREDQIVNFVLTEKPAADFRPKLWKTQLRRAACGLMQDISRHQNTALARSLYYFQASCLLRRLSRSFKMANLPRSSEEYMRQMIFFIFRCWKAVQTSLLIQQERIEEEKRKAEAAALKKAREEQQRKEALEKWKAEKRALEKVQYEDVQNGRMELWIQSARMALEEERLLSDLIDRLRIEPEQTERLRQYTEETILCFAQDSEAALSREQAIIAAVSFSLLAARGSGFLEYRFWQTYSKAAEKISARERETVRTNILTAVRSKFYPRQQISMVTISDIEWFELQPGLMNDDLQSSFPLMYLVFRDSLQQILPPDPEFWMDRFFESRNTLSENLLRRFGTTLKKGLKAPGIRRQILAWLAEVLRMIDCVWKKKKTHASAGYLYTFVNKWCEEHQTEISVDYQTRKTEREPSWTPAYRLDKDNKLIIQLPRVFLPAGVMEAPYKSFFRCSVKEYVLHQKIQYENNCCLMKEGEIKCRDEWLFQSLKYQILVDRSTVYSSQGKLKRSFFVFDDSGREIRRKDGVAGQLRLLFPCKTPVSNLQKIKSGTGWILAQADLDHTEYVQIGKAVLSREKRPQSIIKGQKISNLKILSGSIPLAAYSKVDTLIFYVQDTGISYSLIINGRKTSIPGSWFTRIKALSNSGIYHGWKCEIDLRGRLHSGFNQLKVSESSTGAAYLNRSFYLDPAFSFYIGEWWGSGSEQIRWWSLESSCLISAGNKMEGFAENLDGTVELEIPGPLEHPVMKAQIKGEVPGYSLDGKRWRPLNHALSVSEFSEDGNLTLRGADRIFVRTGKCSVEAPANSGDNGLEISLEWIRNLMKDEESAVLELRISRRRQLPVLTGKLNLCFSGQNTPECRVHPEPFDTQEIFETGFDWLQKKPFLKIKGLNFLEDANILIKNEDENIFYARCSGKEEKFFLPYNFLNQRCRIRIVEASDKTDSRAELQTWRCFFTSDSEKWQRWKISQAVTADGRCLNVNAELRLSIETETDFYEGSIVFDQNAAEEYPCFFELESMAFARGKGSVISDIYSLCISRITGKLIMIADDDLPADWNRMYIEIVQIFIE